MPEKERLAALRGQMAKHQSTVAEIDRAIEAADRIEGSAPGIGSDLRRARKRHLDAPATVGDIMAVSLALLDLDDRLVAVESRRRVPEGLARVTCTCCRSCGWPVPCESAWAGEGCDGKCSCGTEEKDEEG